MNRLQRLVRLNRSEANSVRLSRLDIVGVLACGALLFAALSVATTASAAPKDFPRPASLERDVEFWKRIYSEVGTDAGLLHDTRNLAVVYEITKIPTGLSSRSREKHTNKRKKHYKQILLKLAKGKRSGLSKEEQRVLGLFPAGVSNGTLKKSASRVRFQLGQANKFRSGVIRSGAYKPFILQNLRNMNLPLEIANLPHVESSYTPTVYSRVGAAGLWQFTRSTGRRFMRVDHVVDERLDPYRASIAAARLLEQNLRVTGSWPLAITAYNHGASGMRRAARKLGTKDITKIVRNYRSRTFGFASRNFYVEFLAANAVASDPEFYFGPLVLDQPIAFETAELPYFAKPKELAKAIGIDHATLKEANPGLRSAVWQGSKYIPKGFEVRVPRAALPKPLARGISSLPKNQQFAKQTRDASYVVRRGDTLSTIARRHHVRISELVALNGLRSQHRIRIGQKLKLPSDAARSTQTASHKNSKKKKKTSTRASTPEVTAPAALPESGTYKVRRGDSLSEIADRFGLTIAELVAMNKLRSRNRIAAGQTLRIGSAAKVAAGTSNAATNTKKQHPDAVASLSPARTAKLSPGADDFAATEAAPASMAPESEPEPTDESPTEPSPGLLADPTDYTVASNGTILVQTGETLGHYAEWLGIRASRLRKINGLRFGDPMVVRQRVRLDFAEISPDVFERVRIEYHRSLQEEFFAEWEIEGTIVHRVGPGDSLWVLSTRRYDVPIWLLRQYNPDVNLDALTAGTPLTVPKLRQRRSQTSALAPVAANG